MQLLRIVPAPQTRLASDGMGMSVFAAVSGVRGYPERYRSKAATSATVI